MLNVAARRASGLINMNLTRGRPLQTVLAFSNQLIEFQNRQEPFSPRAQQRQHLLMNTHSVKRYVFT